MRHWSGNVGRQLRTLKMGSEKKLTAYSASQPKHWFTTWRNKLFPLMQTEVVVGLAERDNNQLAERIDRLAETLTHHIEQARKGFDEMNRRFNALTRRMDRFMLWPISTTVATGGIVIGVLRARPYNLIY